MSQCVIYARVSTKEQADEGYSIDAQLKACRELCEREGLDVVAEFVEAESAGKAGRTRFAEMCAYF
ncbi:MAG: recombinase family protein, partial [Actinomycetota bacterium]|nr:recombinase family protein [Actinomycetota bacterium]